MDATQLKVSLIKMGVPVFKNNKVCKRDLEDLSFEESGLDVVSAKPLDHRDEPNKLVCTWHLKIAGGDVDLIENVFYKNKLDVEKGMLCYCHKLGFGAVDAVEFVIKNKNNENVWLEVTYHYNLKEACEKEEACMDPFFHRLFERG